MFPMLIARLVDLVTVSAERRCLVPPGPRSTPPQSIQESFPVKMATDRWRRFRGGCSSKDETRVSRLVKCRIRE